MGRIYSKLNTASYMLIDFLNGRIKNLRPAKDIVEQTMVESTKITMLLGKLDNDLKDYNSNLKWLYIYFTTKAGGALRIDTPDRREEVKKIQTIIKSATIKLKRIEDTINEVNNIIK